MHGMRGCGWRSAAALIASLSLALPTPSAAQRYGAVVGSPHDFTGTGRFDGRALGEGRRAPVCAACHTSSPEDEDGPALGAFGSGLAAGGRAERPEPTLLCLSCHDGVAAQEDSKSWGDQDDHPVSVAYDPFRAERLHPAEEVEGDGVKLFGSGGARRVECSSCHDAHDNRYGAFLRVDRVGSRLCLTCHDR